MTVAFGNVPGKTDAAAFLSAEQYVALEHLRANIFEPDAGLDQRQAMRRAHLVHHRSGRERLDHPPPALSIYNQMMQQQANDLVCRQRVAVAVHAANAIGIAVGHEANVVRMSAEELPAAPVICDDRFGIDAAKQHVMLRIERRDLAGRARQQLFEAAGADTKQSVVGETQF